MDDDPYVMASWWPADVAFADGSGYQKVRVYITREELIVYDRPMPGDAPTWRVRLEPGTPAPPPSARDIDVRTEAGLAIVHPRAGGG